MSQPPAAVDCLTITLPEQTGQPISYQARHADRRPESWQTRPANPIPEATASQIWQEIQADWHNRRTILTRRGTALGGWLLDDRAVQFLRGWIGSWKGGSAPGRVAIILPATATDYLWEAVHLPGIGFLATQRALTVVRMQKAEAVPFHPTPGPVALQVVAVEHKADAKWVKLDTAQEARRIREEISEAAWHNRFVLQSDVQGDWEKHVNLYHPERGSPPVILHFAGHGISHGRGLVFRGPTGEPREIEAERIAQVWSTPDRRGERTRFVFLNACHTSQEGTPLNQPFGGITRQLIAQGIAMVAGLLAPVGDREAREIARTFYQQVGQGKALDSAIQEARHTAYVNDDQGVAWAFLVFTSAGTPAPLLLSDNRENRASTSAHFLRFAFEKQWMRLQYFLQISLPMVVVVNGEQYGGHRHLLRRFQYELEHYPGPTRFVTIMPMNLSHIGDEAVARSQLLGAMAVTFGFRSSGTEGEMIEKVGKAIANLCDNDTLLVVDLEEVLLPINAAWSHALLHLIHVLWVEVTEAAAVYRNHRPVYLLVSVAWPPPPAPGRRRAGDIEQSRTVSLQTIQSLKAKKRPGRDIHVETLPELEPIEEEYVVHYLEDVLRYESERAATLARSIVNINDNETILRRMEKIMNDLEG